MVINKLLYKNILKNGIVTKLGSDQINLSLKLGRDKIKG
jgi:hypothetical protein